LARLISNPATGANPASAVRRVGDPPKDDAQDFIRCPAGDGWIDCRDLGQVHRTFASPGTGSATMMGAQFEIRIDGAPCSYRDRKDYAMEAARLIKSKNPHSMVEVKTCRVAM
jgi:hypothetical protein